MFTGDIDAAAPANHTEQQKANSQSGKQHENGEVSKGNSCFAKD